MRRQDKELTDQAAIARILDEAEWGVLGLVGPAGGPLMVPLNFVRVDDRLYFHSAKSGEKMEALEARGEASFLVVDALAQIPSTVFDPVRACSATQYFRSVLAYGQVAPLADIGRKAEVLQALMEKLQPQGGFTPVTAADPLYKASVAGVAILEFRVARWSAKFEVGQRLTPEKRSLVRSFLERRGGPADRRTLEAMAPDPGSPSPS